MRRSMRVLDKYAEGNTVSARYAYIAYEQSDAKLSENTRSTAAAAAAATPNTVGAQEQIIGPTVAA